METTSIRFAEAARHLGEEARRRGLVVPAFRSPPRCADSSRSIRRRRDGSATVSVALRGRPWPAVLADLIEGVIVTNGLQGGPATTARDGLWSVVAGPLLAEAGEGAAVGGSGPLLAPAGLARAVLPGDHAATTGSEGRRLEAA